MVSTEFAERWEMLHNSTFDEAEIRANFPDILDYLNQRVSIVDVLEDAGIDLRPISPDSTGCLVGRCPFCGEN
jgi:hypothetical protein